MECTQRLECTQELYGAQCERRSPEQIGFLGICGTKYPVKWGPNKIGRDPSTCSIVLNLNSVSRQHAVINVLNGKDFMLMDLDSANKTKLMGKALPAYIPQPLRNGDTVQFGDVFGIFRLLEEEDDLPMTQVMDIPDTPVANKQASRVNNMAATTVPESPDVSDRDDSFIMPTQPKSDPKFKSPSNKFIKQSSKTIAIQPIGSKKIDNIFWSSSKKSTSIVLDDSKSSLNDSAISVESRNSPEMKIEDIHEMETQPPPSLPNGRTEDVDPIYDAATQIPIPLGLSDIHSQDTQCPLPNEYLPQVRKIEKQHDMHIDLYMANKENENIFNDETQLFPNNQDVVKKVDPNIFEAETQITSIDHRNEEKDISIYEANTQLPTKLNAITPESKNDTQECLKDKQTSKDKTLSSDDDIILFDEIDSQSFEEKFSSQRILTDDLQIIDDESDKIKEENNVVKVEVQETSKNTAKREVRLKSDSSTDCEDVEIQQSQKEPFKPKAQDEDLTDCEDDLFDDKPQGEKKASSVVQDSPEIEFEDMPTQILEEDLIHTPNKTNISVGDVDFEDMPTQVLVDKPKDQMDFENLPTQVLVDKPKDQMDFENLPTQVLPEQTPIKSTRVDKIQSEQFSEEVISPFKIPLQTPLKFKRRDAGKLKETPKPAPQKKELQKDDYEEKYYEATQDIINDLCTQEECSPEVVFTPRKNLKTTNKTNQSHLKGEKESSDKNEYVIDQSESSDNEEKVNNFVANLSTVQIREVIGVDAPVSVPTKMPSDPSDGEMTPKKVRPFKLMTTDLPNSQEIKTSVSLNSKSMTTDSSSESEVEEDSQDGTPILFRKKKKTKNNAKMDLTKKFDTSALPTRVITRIRKPTTKLLDGDEECKKLSKRMSKPSLLTDQELEIDSDIIQENITRLKIKSEKKSLDKSVTVKSDNSKHVSFSDIVTNNNEEVSNKEKVSKEENKKDVSKRKERKSKNKKDEKPEDEVTDKIKTKSKEKSEDSKDNSKEKQKDSKSTNISQNKSGLETRSRRKRHKADKKSVKDKKNATADETSLSKTIVSILTTSNSSLKNATASDSNKKRSFRYRGKSDNKIEESPEKEVSIRKRGRPRRSDKKAEMDESSPEPEVRRSRRQRVVKESKVSQPKKGSHEQSTVYSVSSESSLDSPRRKRGATEETRAPSPKRTRSAASLVSSNASSARATPVSAPQTQYVLFTAFPCEEIKAKLRDLGAVMVSEVGECSVVVTLQIRRTFKLLCAVGLGRPVAGPAWLQACIDAGTILDPWDYILEDTVTERRFCFSLRATLRGPRGFLKGCTVSATPSVLPPPSEMQQIVECSGGTWCSDPARLGRSVRGYSNSNSSNGNSNNSINVVVSCSADGHLWPALARRGAHVVSSEFILTGVLRQELDLEKYSLFK